MSEDDLNHQINENDVRQWVHDAVWVGFEARETIVESTLEIFAEEEDVTPDVLRPMVERVAREEWENHAREEALWNGPTDCDRLDQAFAELDKSGIVARQNFTCCNTCGCYEIGGEAQNGDCGGYAFYHQQDTQRAIEGAGLYLSYGVFSEENDAGAIQVGYRIVSALQQNGLKPRWNASVQERIFLPMDWKRRSPTASNFKS